MSDLGATSVECPPALPLEVVAQSPLQMQLHLKSLLFSGCWHVFNRELVDKLLLTVKKV
jgi:hypothetical protein